MPDPLIPNDLTEDQLKWGYWYVTHKLLLRKILIIFLLVINAGMLGFSGYRLIDDILNASAREALFKGLATNYLNPALTKSQAPRAISVSNVQILVSGGKYDFVSTIINPNQNYFGHFSYRFVSGNVATELVNGFVLPGEEKFLVSLGFNSSSRPVGASLELSNISWERVNRHEISNWKTFAAEHINFPITDIAYTPGIEIVSGKPGIGRTSFVIKNNTGFGYYDVRTLVLMYSGPVLVAANATLFPTLLPGAVLPGEVTWYEDLGAISLIKIIPEIDITNSATYLRTQ